MIASWHFFCLVSAMVDVGGVAQLARASALHAEGHRFDSVRLHQIKCGSSTCSLNNCSAYPESDVTKGLGFTIQTSTILFYRGVL